MSRTHRSDGANQPAAGARWAGREAIGFGILMFIITLSFYGWYWVYKTQEEMKRHVGDGLGGVVGLVVWILLGPVIAFVHPVRDREDVRTGRPREANDRLDRALALPGADPHHSRRSSGS